jgi:hypothetical protein
LWSAQRFSICCESLPGDWSFVEKFATFDVNFWAAIYHECFVLVAPSFFLWLLLFSCDGATNRCAHRRCERC